LQYKTIVFDLDGTISDPFVGISRSINYALESLDYDPVDPERIRPLIGPPLTEIFEILLGALRERDMLGLVDKYRERYMGICTSKRADYAQRIVEMFGLAQFFAFVDGGGVGIEKREQIESLVANGLTASSAIMIGDRAVDILAGRSNELASAGVLWGFGERPELEEAAPDHLLESPADLLDLFRH
jgi:phosphoglycolate phosphatase